MLKGNFQLKYRIIALMIFTGTLCSLVTDAAVKYAIQDTKVAPLMTKELTGSPGKEGLMLTVEFAPGAASGKHRHNAHTFVYVLEGSIVMAVAGGKEITLGPGQTFYESPADIHSVSKNASSTKPAKFLVFLVKDKDAPVSIPVNE